MTEIKRIVEAILKEEKSPMKTLKDILIDNIDFDDYDSADLNAKGDKKIIEMFKIFRSERDFDIRTKGIRNALIN